MVQGVAKSQTWLSDWALRIWVSLFFGSLMVWWWWSRTIISLITRGPVSCSRPQQPVTITHGALKNTTTRALSPKYWFVLVKGRAQAAGRFKISQVSRLCGSKHCCQLLLRTLHSHSVWIRWYLHLNEHFLKAYANNHQGATPPFSCDWQQVGSYHCGLTGLRGPLFQ